jgi:hypothetical protein
MTNNKHLHENTLKRRRFLQGLSILGLAPLAPGLTFATRLAGATSDPATSDPATSDPARNMANKPRAKNEYWLSAQGDHADNYSASWISRQDQNTRACLSGFRGHEISPHPLKADHALMFSRRPGTLGIELNLRNGQIQQQFSCTQHRHLTGHGCFSQDGNILFTSESHYPSGRGKIGLRDARSYEYLGEYDSHGIGPHQIKLMPDGQTLVVANGGILTHPDSGRKKLNLDSMQSNLSYIDINNGRLLETHYLSEPKASLRHIDVSSNGTVALAVQMQREAANHNNTVALCAIHNRGGDIVALQAPDAVFAHMKDYVGSVAINQLSNIAGFASPRGNLVAFWDIKHNHLAGYHKLNDVCGITASADQRHFVISNSSGQLRLLDAHSLKEDIHLRQHHQGQRWDNHLSSLIMA